MKHLSILFFVLLTSFLGIWTYKIKTPVNRLDEYAQGYDENAGVWWNTGNIEVDDDWKLDPEIPLNYMPVPGEYELYMVIDNDGNITGYRQRTKQIDGSWLWSDVNPDIPEDYEPVEGLEDVYRVTQADGSISYYRYIRNSDDTFAFLEVDEKGNTINKNRDATTIDSRHVHITGNIYSELNEHGVVIGYDKRIENADGTFSWMETSLPTLPDMSEMDQKLTYEGNLINNSQKLDTSEIESMQDKMNEANNNIANSTGDTYNIDVTVNPGATTDFTDLNPSTPTIVNNADGTHTEIEVIRETKNIDGWTTTYETYVKKTYDDTGNLLTTMSEGPYEVETVQNITKETEPIQTDKVNKLMDLSQESARVTGSYNYKAEVGSEVFAKLNAQRSSNGLSSLQLTDTAMQIAMLRAADMAGYDTSDEDLPTYGSLGTMLSDYKISYTEPGENIWKSTPRNSDDIHTRFQSIDSSRNIRMSKSATQYGIAIVEKNGYYYICEIVL